MDFIHDQLVSGRSFLLSHVVGDFNLEGLGIEVKFSLASELLISFLDQTIQ